MKRETKDRSWGSVQFSNHSIYILMKSLWKTVEKKLKLIKWFPKSLVPFCIVFILLYTLPYFFIWIWNFFSYLIFDFCNSLTFYLFPITFFVFCWFVFIFHFIFLFISTTFPDTRLHVFCYEYIFLEKVIFPSEIILYYFYSIFCCYFGVCLNTKHFYEF